MANRRVPNELCECARACALLFVHCVQDIQWLRDATNTITHKAHDRLLTVVEKLKIELMYLRTHANLPAAGSTETTLDWYNANNDGTLVFVKLLVDLAATTPMGSVHVERLFGEISK